MRLTATIAVTAVLLCGVGIGQTARRPDASAEKFTFATNRCFSKGGLGIINTSLYIVVKSTKNELLFGKSEHWSGLEKTEPEVVVFFDGKIWLSRSLPKGFDLSRSIVVSFENNKIRFFDFQKMSGGYYERITE